MMADKLLKVFFASQRLLITFEKYKCAHACNSWRKQPLDYVDRCYDGFANMANGEYHNQLIYCCSFLMNEHYTTYKMGTT